MIVSVFSLIVYISTIVFSIPIKSNLIDRLREKRKLRNDIAEFDVAYERNQTNNNLVKTIGGKLETQLGRTYEFLGDKIADLGTQLEDNKDNLAEKASNIYKGPFADKTGVVYEKLQYGYGAIGDRLSSILHWLGGNVIQVGRKTSSLIRSGFHTVGDVIGDTIDGTEQLIGNGLVKASEKVHQSAVDLQRTSHTNSESLRHQLQDSAPQFERSLTNTFGHLGEKLHSFGVDTETAGEIIEQHHFLDTIKQAYRN